ncbi:MAG: DUF2071 domain-containing protein [Myxococcales bacterium]
MSEALLVAPPLSQSRWSFLTAEWRHLCLVNYAVDPARLEPFLPPGLSLDVVDGEAFVSLVAFDFLHTRVLGVSWPGYRSFPEINLRFYVREGDRRGVCFIREFVPKRLVAWLARSLYNEPYAAVPMRSSVRLSDDVWHVEHVLQARGRTQRLALSARNVETIPAESSQAHFFKEHSWGYGRSRSGELTRYEVRHEVWAVYQLQRWQLDWEFGAVYGPDWADLARTEPRSVLLAKGSPIRVSGLA